MIGGIKGMLGVWTIARLVLYLGFSQMGMLLSGVFM